MKKINNKSTKLKFSLINRIIIVAVPIALIIILILIISMVNRFKTNQSNFVMDVLEGLSTNQQIQLETYIEEKEALLTTLTQFPELYSLDRSQYVPFLFEKGNIFGFPEMFVVDNYGIGYYPSEGVERDQSDEPFFEIISSRDFYVTDPFYSGYGPITTLCKAIYTKGGKRVGTLCAKVTLDSIQLLLEDNVTIIDGECFIVNSEGLFITYSNKSDLYTQKSIFSRKNCDFELLQKALDENQDCKGTIIFDGVENYAYIKYIPSLDWAIVACTPVENVFSSLNSIIILQYSLLIMIVILSIVVILIIRAWRQSDTRMYTDSICNCGSQAACLKMMETIDKDKSDYIILFTDLNKFKFVNDNYGHETGDIILKIFSNVLLEVYGRIAFVGRMGGDEFVIFAKNQTIEYMETLWSEVDKRLKEESAILDFEYEIAAAHGCVVRPRDSYKKMHEIVHSADKMMYVDKGKHSR